MHLSELIHGFFTDLWRLPLMFQLALLAIFAIWGWQWWKAARRKKLEKDALSWPSNSARVISTQVSDRKRQGKNGPVYWEGILTYSYSMPGQELEIGESRPRFYDAESANAWARTLQDSCVSVRVDPANARRSVWLDEENSSNRAIAEVKASRAQAGTHWGGSTRVMLAVVLFAISGVGAVGSLWIQLSCLRGRPIITAEANAGIFFAMHIGVIVSLIAAHAIVFPFRTGDIRNWSQSAANGFKQSWILKVLSAYCTIVFFYAWVRMASRDGNPDFWGILMFSDGWLVGYLYATEMCWKVLTRTEESSTVS